MTTRKEQVKKKCKICSKVFYVYPSLSSRQFYSNACRGKGIIQPKEHLENMRKLSKGKLPRGEKHWNWKGGKFKDVRGYVFVKAENHPLADEKGYVREHRLVMEKYIGRTLLPTEVVHHVNGIIDDNRVQNLMLFSSQAEHVNADCKWSKQKEVKK